MTKRILICEDTDQVVAALRASLEELTSSHGDDVEFDVITTSSGAQQLSSQLGGSDYDLVLLDHFAPDGDFHVLEFEKIGAERVIVISSIARYNQQALERGAAYAVTKDNPLTDESAFEIVTKAEHILYKTGDNQSQYSHNFDNTASS